MVNEDAPPQVRGDGKRHPRYLVEFHKGGATQVNLVTNTRRTVRRIEVTTGFVPGAIRKDPCSVYNMPGLDAAQQVMQRQGSESQLDQQANARPWGQCVDDWTC